MALIIFVRVLFCGNGETPYICNRLSQRHAAIAQLVEHDLAKVGVASSSLVCRSCYQVARMVEW